MASPETLAIPSWLQSLPRAPEYRPTETEFADPISFISRIEREASSFGICKIIPPFSRPSKKFVLSNLNSSLSQSSNLPIDLSKPAVFTTRHQELGTRKNGVGHQQVWQSGESYTLEQFESKARVFYRAHLSGVKEVRPLLVESLFWKAARDKPVYIEYANDVPGSGFPSRKGEMKTREPGWRLSESPWNLQVIARAHGSLTKFMPDDVPGVTSPMVYIGMLYSWFAWHIEDHELHSLNFLHTGAPKTWYAVPSDHAAQLEEIIRLKGYGGTFDQLASLGKLGEKTTLLSPEIIVASGVPCCRLVQNPGEFVVTFPRAYHVGFSHGFNCGEAANFATPQWLKFAKEAAVRRAAMNFLPMLSHQQLLYLLAISFISRNPSELLLGIRTSRLRDRKKEDRELLIKKAFLQDMVNENQLLCTLLSRRSTFKSVVLWEPAMLPGSSTATFTVVTDNGQMENSSSDEEDGLPFGLRVDSGSLTCVACGILGYPFMAVLQPSEEALNKILSTSGEQLNKESAGPQCCTLIHNDLISTDNLNSDDAGLESIHASCSGTETRDVLQTDEPTVSTNDTKSSCHSTKERETESDSIERHSSCTIPSESGPTKLSHEQSEKVGRSRLFCLQHALQTEELLQNEGGARALAICHADYLKIKALAISIAEETNIDISCTDINLEKASPSDVYLINLSIDDEMHEEDGTDWTAKLGLNLKYGVKVRKEQPKNQNFNLALELGGLFADQPTRAPTRAPTKAPTKAPISLDSSDMVKRWLSRKPRTPYKVVGTIVEGASSENWVNIAISTAECPQIDQIKGDLNVCVESNESDASMSSARMGVETTISVSSAEAEPEASNSMQIDDEAPDQSTPPHAVQCYVRRAKKQESEEEKRDSFARSPCEGLRPRKAGPSLSDPLEVVMPQTVKKRPYVFNCDNEGCKRRFRSRNEMDIHKRYRCMKQFDTGESEMR